jgi:glycosyltransferase involved in cell wall biosynthesis
MAEVVEDGRTGLLFTPGDAGELAARIAWAASHPLEIGRMRREARAEFEARYTAERNYQALIEIYERARSTRN